MKVKLILSILLATSFLLSCENVYNVTEEKEPTEQGDDPTSGYGNNAHKIKIKALSATGNTTDIVYPVTAYAFDTSGKLQGEHTITSEGQTLSLSLPSGSYTINTVSGTVGYNIPSEPATTSVIRMSSSYNYANQALMLSSNTFTLGESITSLNIILGYVVARLNIVLKDIPEDITSVKVNVNTQYAGVTFDNIGDGTSSTTIDCTKDVDGIWKTGDVYVFPTVSASTSLSINLYKGDDSVSYGFNYPSPLRAATPYSFTGTFRNNQILTLTGSLSASGWNEEVRAEFNFGPDAPSGGIGYDSSSDSYTVATLPSACSAWNGHVVAWVENVTATEEDAYLISLGQFNGVHSASTTGYETEASSMTSAYTEGGMSGWNIPTREQATTFTSMYYSDFLDPLNQLIAAQTSGVDVENKERYLCEDAKYAYTISNSPNIKSAGIATTYRLRLIKKIHFKKG